jgi:cell division protein ZipA
MMSELRWTLLILGVVFIAVLAWWERRRPRQASGALERTVLRESLPDTPPRPVRDPPLTLPEVHPRAPPVTQDLPVVELEPEMAEEGSLGRAVRTPRVQPHEVPAPAEAREAPGTPPEADDEDEMHAADDMEEADYMEEADQLDEAAAGHVEAGGAEELVAERAGIDVVTEPASAAEAQSAASSAGVRPPREVLPELPAAEPMRVDWPSQEERRILALRLVAPKTERFPGRSLRQALAAEGFLLGQFAIFHKPDDERRAVLSAASLTRPGTFDMETMDSQHYGGLSLFAVLPGPKPPPQAFDELVFAARNLNERLHGVLQDEHGAPLTPARIAQLREQLRTGTLS